MAACEHGMPLTLGCDDCTIARLNKQRQDDEALIQRMLEALETCNDSGPYPHYYEVELVEEAAAAARARLTPPTA